jgi:hypothetical protein
VSALAAETLAALLAIRLHDASLSDVLDKIVGVVKETLDGAEEVSVTTSRSPPPTPVSSPSTPTKCSTTAGMGPA